MKKILYLLFLMSIVSCSDSSNSITNPEPKPENPSVTGNVALTFTKALKSSSLNKSTNISDFPTPTNVRVLIRRFGDRSLEFNALADVKVPTDTTIMIEVPAGDNYQIDAFSYIDSTDRFKPILKTDQVNDVSVTADEITHVSLNLEEVSPKFAISDTVTRGDNFEITAELDGIYNGPIGNNTQYTANIIPDSVYQNSLNDKSSDFFDNYSNPFDDTVPDFEWDDISISNFDGIAYFQMKSIIFGDEFYKDQETKFSFVLNYPNPFINDTLKTYVKIPEGGIGIDVTY